MTEHRPDQTGTPTYPPAPWTMHGSMWITAFRLGTAADERHPAGTYAVGLVSYDEPSPLTYHELMVARTTKNRHGKSAVTITDIWVDSPASMAGGRALWAIPKDLCDFDLDTGFRGPLTSTHWSATVDRKPIVEADFTDVSRVALRVPFSGRVEQPGIAEHPDVADVSMRGTAKALPCRGRWTFFEDGPLGFLCGARKLASFRMAGFGLRFD